MKQIDCDFPQKDFRNKAVPAINFPSSRRHQLDIDLLEKFQLPGSSFQAQTLMRAVYGLPHKKSTFPVNKLFIYLFIPYTKRHS